jgi:hypothetical protein
MADRCKLPDHTADPVVFGACPCGIPQPPTRVVPSAQFYVPGLLDHPEPLYRTVLGPDEMDD